MTEKEMWNAYLNEHPCYVNETYDSWSYGSDDPDLLAELTISGIKTAAASAYPFYEYEKCDLPKPGCHSVIIKTDGSALCVIRTLKVEVVPFLQVSAEQAYKEGEGDRSLKFWRDAHIKAFTSELAEINEKFTEDMLVVCEEFQVVYPMI